MSDNSGAIGGNENFLSILMNAVSAADSYYQRGQVTAKRNFDNAKLVDVLSRIEFGMELFSGHQNYMQSGFNSFLTLRLAMLPNGLRAESGKESVLMNATINGCAGLLRQSLENLVRSIWLLEASSQIEISQRGFAVLWENASNHLKYERALNGSRIEEFEINLKELHSSGVHHGFFDLIKGSQTEFSKKPRIRIQDASGLLRKVITPVELPQDLLQERGIGFVNAEWVYRWLSGLTHGLDWAHVGLQLPDEMDFAFVNRTPDIERFSIAALFVLQLGQELFQLTDGKFESTLLAMSTE